MLNKESQSLIKDPLSMSSRQPGCATINCNQVAVSGITNGGYGLWSRHASKTNGGGGLLPIDWDG